MKKVLMQDRNLSLEALDSIADLLSKDINSQLKIETTSCLSVTQSNIEYYNLLLTLPDFGLCTTTIPLFVQNTFLHNF